MFNSSHGLCAAIAATAVSSITLTATAGIFVSTGHTGAQVQCDIAHTQHWTYSVSQDVTDITGALLTMKGGSQTTASITFTIFEGDYSAFGTAPSLLTCTLGRDAFSQSFDWVEFFGAPISLFANHTYTAVLYSNAPDVQSEAYFIKGGSDTPLKFVDSTGTPVDNGGSITPPVPAPGAIALLGLAGFARRRRR